jgi:hypothetical protein
MHGQQNMKFKRKIFVKRHIARQSYCLCESFCGSYTEAVNQNFVSGRGVSTNSVEDRGQRERGSGGGSPLLRGSTQFANE